MSRPLLMASFCWWLFVVVAGSCAAEEPLRSKIYFIPLGFIADVRSDSDPLSDARPYLKSVGIDIPEGGEATFDREYSTLTVRAPNTTIKRVDVLVNKEFEPLQVDGVEFSLVESVAQEGVDVNTLTYERIREMAGDSWHVIDRASVRGKSG